MNFQANIGGFITIDKDWFGRTGPEPSFQVFRENEDWIFRVRVNQPALGHPGAAPGQYREGLWRYDVAEWFVADRDSGRYIEWNLAPGGAWWMMPFVAPRKRSDHLPDLQLVRTKAHMGDKDWEAELRVPQSLFDEYLGKGVLTHNACFVLGHPRRYFSWVKFPIDEPDFHLPKYFRALNKM